MSLGLGEGRIGFLGGGQLARMMAMAAKRLGLTVSVFDPSESACAFSFADHRFIASWDDKKAVRQFIDSADRFSIDHEHVPVEVLQKIEKKAFVAPSSSVLATIQDRLEQRRFLSRLGVGQTEYFEINSSTQVSTLKETLGSKVIFKTRRQGYDGKGQKRVDLNQTQKIDFSSMKDQWVAEKKIDFVKEISAIVCRSADGNFCDFPVVENRHEHGILVSSHYPADVSKKVAATALEVVHAIAEALDYVGVMAVEFFLSSSDQLKVNEIAPRVHNSGHFTWGACLTSQFEQHVRAVMALPLGDPSLVSKGVMLNLMGDLWQTSKPRFNAMLQIPGVEWVLYGKSPARLGRKMGHCLVHDHASLDAVALRFEQLKKSLEI